MKVNEQWLKSFVDYPLSAAALAEALTHAGIEVENVEAGASEGSLGSVLTLKIPPNRGDCLSVEGLAREVSAMTDQPLKIQKPENYTSLLSEIYPVEVQTPAACPSLHGCVIDNLENTRTTPVWILEKLRMAGIAPLSIVMDILHYVMLELGQPFHAFDRTSLLGSLVIRKAQALEVIRVSDQQSMTLDTETLVIADQANIQAIAGVVGAAASAVTPRTRALVLLSAAFDPIAIRCAAQRYGIHSEASYRFERGIDPGLAKRALERALLLITQITQANVGPIASLASVDESASMPSSLFLARTQIQQCLGITLDDQTVTALLGRLQMQVTVEADGFRVRPPAYRLDLKLAVDLIEELGRLYGFDRIPAVDFAGAVQAPVVSDRSIQDQSIKALCVNRGYSEIISYSFIDPVWADRLGMSEPSLHVANPISSEMSMMRSSLWPGLLTALEHNQRRQIKRLRLFELGTCFMAAQDRSIEKPKLAGLWAGSLAPEQWGLKARAIDFYDLKGDVEALLSLLGKDVSLRFEAVEHPVLQKGQAAAIYQCDQNIGIIGMLHPRLIKDLDLQGPIGLFELDRSAFKATMPSFEVLSKYPSVRRDIALLVSKNIPAAALKQSVVDSAGAYLQQVLIFDVYENKALEASQKSIALALIFQHPTRTLEEAEIKTLVEGVVQALGQQFQASLRE